MSRRWSALLLLAPLLAGAAPLALESMALEHGPERSLFRAGLSGDLGERATEALHNGVPITLRWSLELRDRRPLAWNVLLWESEGRIRLGYRPLSRRYSLEDVPGERQRSFPRLSDLLDALHRFELELPPLARVTGGNRDVAVRFRLRLDIVALPPALRLPGYLDGEWRIDTGWEEKPAAAPTGP